MALQSVEQDALFMAEALDQAGKAYEEGEVPVGAAAVYEGEIIALGRNMKERLADPTAHAEMELLREAARKRGAWRLTGVTVYVTLEPCPMCAGAFVLARIDRLVYGASDPKMGAVRSLYRIADDGRLNHRMEITGGVMAAECGEILTRFFKERRSGD